MKKLFCTRLLLALICFALLPSTFAQRKSSRQRPNAARQTTRSTPVAVRRAPTPTPTVAAKSNSIIEAKPDVNLDEMFAAGSYGLFMEVRSLVEQLDSPIFKQAMLPLYSMGVVPVESKAWLEFLTGNRDALAQSRVVVLTMPVKTGLPQFVVALETPSSDDALRLESKVKKLVRDITQKGATAKTSGRNSNTAARQATSRRTRNKARKTSSKVAGNFVTQRAGRVILVSDAPVTLAALRPKNSSPFVSDARFQEMRSRLAAETMFAYFDFIAFKKITAAQNKAALKTPGDETQKRGVIIGNVVVPSVSVAVPSIDVEAETPVVVAKIDAIEAQPTAPMEADETIQSNDDAEENAPANAAARSDINALSSLVFPALFGNLTRGYENMESLAMGMNMNGNEMSVRVLISNKEGTPVGPVPFFPMLVSGAPYTSQAAAMMPADTGIFISLSLDFPRIYDELIGAVNSVPQTPQSTAKPDAQVPTASPIETRIAAIEARYGFKIKDELISALGNEIALGVSTKWLYGEEAKASDKQDEADKSDDETVAVDDVSANATPAASSTGIYFLVAVQDKARLQRLLPFVLEIFGFPIPQGVNLIERKDGIESVLMTNNMISFVGDYMIIAPDAAAASRVHAAQTGANLTSTANFNNSRSWQSAQRLGEIYVSGELVKRFVEKTRRPILDAIGASENLFNDASIEVAPVTYVLTKDGSSALHEVHFPNSALMLMSQLSALSAANQEIVANDSAAQSALWQAFFTHNQRKQLQAIKDNKDEEQKEAMREVAENLSIHLDYLDETKDKPKANGYRIEIRTNGDKFEATATPESYGVTGRRSFFMDENGTLRGADNGGRAATATDKKIN